jgi:hypothetical protein
MIAPERAPAWVQAKRAPTLLPDDRPPKPAVVFLAASTRGRAVNGYRHRPVFGYGETIISLGLGKTLGIFKHVRILDTNISPKWCQSERRSVRLRRVTIPPRIT